VTKRPQGAEERSSPLAVLTDPSKLDAQFVVQESGTSNGLEWITLTPKGDASSAGFRTAKLGFGAQGLARMQVVDQLGQRTDIAFSGWKRNAALPATTFRFTPPKGVDVIGG
jgi:outer membrane lipoprotein carrier protein